MNPDMLKLKKGHELDPALLETFSASGFYAGTMMG